MGAKHSLPEFDNTAAGKTFLVTGANTGTEHYELSIQNFFDNCAERKLELYQGQSSAFF